jgi:NAD+ diphosphatase
MTGRFIPAVTPSQGQDQAASSRWFIFSGHRLLVRVKNGAPEIPVLRDGLSSLGLEAVRSQFLGTLDGQACYSADVPEGIDAPPGMLFSGLRGLFDSLDGALYRVAVVAVQVVDWDRIHQFCGRCGEKTRYKEGERAKECPRCGLTSFPRISPAVIVAVERDQEILLARANRFPTAFYSVLAGFVEPGETLEETVAREVKEEVGIELTNIRYFGSQPWPFPDSLMIGFTAQYAGGEICIDGTEIVDAGWFEADELPELPGKISIARQLIDWFVEKKRQKE